MLETSVSDCMRVEQAPTAEELRVASGTAASATTASAAVASAYIQEVSKWHKKLHGGVRPTRTRVVQRRDAGEARASGRPLGNWA